MDMSKSFGATPSPLDSRTIKHENLTMVATAPVKGGYVYLPENIRHQHKVGICTAISLTQNREKATGKKFNADFQYLLQKKYYDLNWNEGSSINTALKVGKKYGFLPESEWKHTTEADRELPYAQYIAKLQTVSDTEINRLLALCTDNLTGYASVSPYDPQALAKAIVDSEAGILCRYQVGFEWYTSKEGFVSWKPEYINPLRPPQLSSTGHAVTMSSYDYSTILNQVIANTWGIEWNNKGCGDIMWTNYAPTEAFTILTVAPTMPPFQFKFDLFYMITSPDVARLQELLFKQGFPVALSGPGSNGEFTKTFGLKTLAALKKWQQANGIPATGYFGLISRTLANKLVS